MVFRHSLLLALLALGDGVVLPIVDALDLADHLLHLAALPRPLAGAELGLAGKQLVVGAAVAAAEAVPDRRVLAVIIIKIEVVHGVARRAVDDGRVGHVLAVVDQDGPEVDEHEQPDVGELLQGKQEREDVVRQRLRPAVDGVEGVRGVGRRHDPAVMGLVQRLVDGRVVQTAVDPVDAEVGEDEEQGELQPVVARERLLAEAVVALGVAAHLGEEEGQRQDRHDGHGDHGLPDLEADLVLEVLGVVEGALVKDEEVGQAGEQEVDEQSKDPASSC